MAYVKVSRAKERTTVYAVADSVEQAAEDLRRSWTQERRIGYAIDQDNPSPSVAGGHVRHLAEGPGAGERMGPLVNDTGRPGGNGSVASRGDQGRWLAEAKGGGLRWGHQLRRQAKRAGRVGGSGLPLTNETSSAELSTDPPAHLQAPKRGRSERAPNGRSRMPVIAAGAVHSRCMSATRTQVYLTEDQRRRIDEIARADGVTLAEVVRRALDAYLSADRDASADLAATFGADPHAAAPRRDKWDRA
ncbi:MAG: ribbon-helix-helix domain-containing protein [Actinomycetota bacterium]|nr:ribbon-helix-helix domain-containing protein [Actinomycetota bacterium]